jgi:hypothetical protein
LACTCWSTKGQEHARGARTLACCAETHLGGAKELFLDARSTDSVDLVKSDVFLARGGIEPDGDGDQPEWDGCTHENSANGASFRNGKNCPVQRL